MGKGRAPCCDKSQVKKGPWSPAEDLRLITFIQKHGHENWRALPKQAGLLRCGKSCRLRWINYLRPDVKRGNFTKEEEDTIIKLHQTLGNKWSKIASHLPGRTDNEIKNVWNTHLKKRLSSKDKDNFNNKKESNKESSTTTTSSSSSSSTSTIMSCGKRNNNDNDEDDQWNQGSVSKRTRGSGIDTPENEEADNNKELMMSSSSTSSDNSNVTNYSSLVDDYKQQQQDDQIIIMGTSSSPLLNFSSDQPNYDDIFKGALELEVNKPDQNQTIEQCQDIILGEVEIPFESDLDFWNMLDGLNPSPSNNLDTSCERSSTNNNNTLGDDSKKWLRYLENELGLEDGTRQSVNLSDDQDPGIELITDNNFHYDQIPVKSAQVNTDEMGYYHMWSSSSS